MRSGRKLNARTESPGRIRASLADRRGGDELVGLAALVRGAHRLLAGLRVVVGRALAEQLDRGPGALPALVAVHRVVAPDHGADPAGAALAADGLDAGDRARAGRRRRVAPVGERVDHEVGHVPVRGERDERLEVLVGGVHAALGDEPDQVHAVGAAQRRPQRLALAERAVAHGGVDPQQVLRHDRARAEVEVADLRVAHLARGQADRLALGRQRRVRVLGPQPVEHRRVGERDRVARPVGSESPAVEHYEADRRDGHARAAISTIAAKSAGSRLAPPTSAPSTSGSAISSAALSGLQEPP